MNKKIKIAFYIILSICLLVLGAFFYGKYLGGTQGSIPKKEITSQVILDRVKDQYFLVTKTMFYNDKVTIVATQNSGWKDFLWGQEITAYGIVRVDIGVDVNKMNPSDVIVNTEEKTIRIIMPKSEVLDSSLNGDLDIRTKKGVFTNIGSIFTSNKGEDYNMAVRELIESAEYSAATNEKISNEARRDAAKLIKLIIDSLRLDYEIIVE